VAFQAGRAAEARQALADHLARNEEDADAWLALGLMSVRSGNLGQGLSALRRVARLRPMAPEPYRELAAAYQIAGDQRAADCERSAEALERDQVIDLQAVISHMRRGATADAIAVGLEILQRHPSAIRVRYELALAHQAHNDYESVADNLRLIANELPASASVAKTLADFLWACHRLKHLAQSFSLAILGSAGGGNVLSPLHQVEDLYRAAIRHDPEWAEARTYFANVLRETDRLGEALEHYRAAAEYAPGDAIAHCNLASALAAAGEISAAIESAREATILRPDFGEAHELLARLAWLVKDAALALAHDSRALRCERFYTTQAFL
jgi:protein O-GlcNAc transferase